MSNARSSASLKNAMQRTVVSANGVVDSKKPDIPVDILNKVADEVQYARFPQGVPGNKVDTPSNCITVAGKIYPLKQEVLLEPALVKKVFKGNRRNQRNLKGIDQLALSITPAGHNTVAVKVRPLPDGSGFELINGSRRKSAVERAAELSPEKDISLLAIIDEIDDITATKEAAMENAGREDLTPWEQADQLEELLEEGVCTKVDELIPYLPPSKRNIDRTTVHLYLIPARISKEVRAYINETIDAKLGLIRKLKRRLDAFSDVEPAILLKMKEDMKVGYHSVTEIVDFIDKNFADTQPKKTSYCKEIKNKAGSMVATVTVKPNGKVTIDFDKSLAQAHIDDALNNLEKIIADI